MEKLSALWATAKDNVGYLLVCLLVFVGVFVVATLVERLWLKPTRQSPARRAAYIGIFGAIAAVLMYFEISLPFAPAFYQIDLSEVPVFICSFSLGPVAGVVCELVKIILKLLLKGTSTAFVGDFANFVVGCSFVLPATIWYHAHKSKHSAVIGLILGTVSMSILGSAFNAVYLLPKFSQLFELPLDAIIAMGAEINGNIHNVTSFVFFCVAPLNVVKGAVVSVLTMLLYKRVARPLFGIHK